MRFKLFVVCALACGFMAYVLANENISTEEDLDDQAINAVPEIVVNPKPSQPVKPKADTEFVGVIKDVPKTTTKPKPSTSPSPKPTPGGQRMIPVVHVTSRGTDDVLTVAGLKPQKTFGALIMPDDYMGELIDVNTGYNWGEFPIQFLK